MRKIEKDVALKVSVQEHKRKINSNIVSAILALMGIILSIISLIMK